MDLPLANVFCVQTSTQRSAGPLGTCTRKGQAGVRLLGPSTRAVSTAQPAGASADAAWHPPPPPPPAQLRRMPLLVALPG